MAALRDDRERVAYVHRVMVNAFLRGRRRLWNREVPTLEVVDEHGVRPTETLLVRVEVLAALRRLPARQRLVIGLRFLADLTESDTAAAMQCSVGTVKSHSARAFATLRVDPALAGLLIEENTP